MYAFNAAIQLFLGAIKDLREPDKNMTKLKRNVKNL